MRVFLGLILVLGTVWSQSPPSAPSITGVVMDSSNASVAGATVTLRRMSDHAQRIATVEATGIFRFDGVAPGDYEVEIRHVGFQPSLSRMRVGSRSPAPLKIVLAVAELREGVTVDSQTDQVSTETSQNLNAVSMSQKSLENLPIFDQDYVGTMSRFLDAGSIGTGGVTVVVDGLESTRVPVSPSAIQEVKINQDPYSAEFAPAAAGSKSSRNQDRRITTARPTSSSAMPC